MNITQKMSMLVGLKQVNDLDLIYDDAVFLKGEFSNAEKKSVYEIASIINELYDTFDYLTCPEFLDDLTGRSDEYKSMKHKLVTAQKQKEMRLHLSEAIVGVLTSTRINRLVPVNKQGKVERLKALVSTLRG